MSIVPRNSGFETWDWGPISDLWNHHHHPLLLFPFPNPTTSLETQVGWRETPTAHLLRAQLPGCSNDDVLVFVDEGGITTNNADFITRFKLPDDAAADQMEGFMENGLLLVTIPKHGHPPRNVRVVEIAE